MDPSVKDIQEILRIFLDSELQDLRLEIGGVRLAVTKAGKDGAHVAAWQPFGPAANAPETQPGPAFAALPAAAAAAAASHAASHAASPAASRAASPAVPSAPTTRGAPNLAASATSAAAVDVHAGWVAVTAPSLGSFYRRPAPDQQPFVEVGSTVAANDTICLIEVMKMFTGVVAPCTGRIASIQVEDAALVEHGQILMYLEPN